MLAKAQALKNPIKILFDLSTHVLATGVYLWYVPSNKLLNINASRRGLFGSFQHVGHFPWDGKFPVVNVWTVLLKNMKVIMSSEWDVHFPCWALLFLGPPPGQWGHHEQDICCRNQTQTWRKAACQQAAE